jgi:hypothetical protein
MGRLEPCSDFWKITLKTSAQKITQPVLIDRFSLSGLVIDDAVVTVTEILQVKSVHPGDDQQR